MHDQPARQPRQPRLPWLPVMAIAIPVSLLYLRFIVGASFVWKGTRYWTLRDDALISMTYARNLAEGMGLTWSGHDVEGYTNLGWTLWMATIHAVGFDDRTASLAVMISAAALLGTSGWISWRLAWRLFGSRPAAWAASLLVLLCYPLMYWAMTGMEVGALAAIALGSCLLADRIIHGSSRDMPLLCLLLALGVIIRTDFAIVAILVAAALWIRCRRGAPAATVIITLGLHSIFRLVYHGDILPNTYYLKMTGIPILQRVAEGAAAFTRILPLLVVVVVLAGITLAKLPRHRTSAALLAAVFLGQVAYSIWVGGDAWEVYGFANRYISVGLPLLLVLAVGVIPMLAEERRIHTGFAAAFVGTLLFLTSSGLTMYQWFPAVGPEVTHHHVPRWSLELREASDPDTTVAVTWAGAVPYFSHRSAVDLLGKMDRVVARGPVRSAPADLPQGHRKWDYEHSIGVLRPDLVPWLWWEPEAACERMAEWGYVETQHGFVQEGVDVVVPEIDRYVMRCNG